MINSSEDVMDVVRKISEKGIDTEQENDDGEDGEAEVVALAKRCLEMGSNSNAETPGGGSSSAVRSDSAAPESDNESSSYPPSYQT